MAATVPAMRPNLPLEFVLAGLDFRPFNATFQALLFGSKRMPKARLHGRGN